MKLLAFLPVLCAASLITFSSSVVAANRPNHFDMELAVPIRLPVIFPRLEVGAYSFEFVRCATVAVDSSGAVREVLSISPPDSVFAVCYDAFLRGIAFSPGTRDGIPDRQIIPILIRINPQTSFPVMTFPVDSAGRIDDADLYFSALGLNGIKLPRLTAFPSYFFNVHGANSAAVCPYLLLKLDLKSDGSLVGMDLLHSTAGGFTQQLMSAVHWGEYVAGELVGPDSLCDIFLVISLFPGVSYPTMPLDANLDSLSVLDRVRVELRTDSVGLMVKPVPRHLPPRSEYQLQTASFSATDTIALRIRIDTLGRAVLIKAAGVSNAQSEVYRSFVQSFEFCPALDWSGAPRQFEGLLLCERSAGSTKIRIHFCWLTDECYSCIQ